MSFDLFESSPVTILSPTPTYPKLVTGSIGSLSDTASAPCTGEIKQVSASAPCTGEIVLNAIAAPTDPLGVHLSQGTLIFSWGHPALNRVSYFEIYASLTAAGPFFQYPAARFPGLFGYINNFPLGTVAYFRIRAVGKNRLKSSFADVQRGKFNPIEGTLTVTTISGTVLNAGVRFSALHPVTRYPVTFAVKEDTTVT